MPANLIAAGIGGVTSIIGGIQSGDAAKNAAAAEQAAQQRTIDYANNNLANDKSIETPYTNAGATATNQMLGMFQPGGSLSGFQYNPSTDPSTQFRLQQGEQAQAQLGNAQFGGAQNGNTQRALLNYGQQAASQEYSNAFNRYLQQGQLSLTGLGNIAQTGAQATGNLVSAGNYATGVVGGANTQSGQAQAAGDIGQANAINNTLSGVNKAAGGYLSSLPGYSPPTGTYAK